MVVYVLRFNFMYFNKDMQHNGQYFQIMCLQSREHRRSNEHVTAIT